jgi:hypothetical protein
MGVPPARAEPRAWWGHLPDGVWGRVVDRHRRQHFQAPPPAESADVTARPATPPHLFARPLRPQSPYVPEVTGHDSPHRLRIAGRHSVQQLQVLLRRRPQQTVLRQRRQTVEPRALTGGRPRHTRPGRPLRPPTRSPRHWAATPPAPPSRSESWLGARPERCWVRWLPAFAYLVAAPVVRVVRFEVGGFPLVFPRARGHPARPGRSDAPHHRSGGAGAVAPDAPQGWIFPISLTERVRVATSSPIRPWPLPRSGLTGNQQGGAHSSWAKKARRCTPEPGSRGAPPRQAVGPTAQCDWPDSRSRL